MMLKFVVLAAVVFAAPVVTLRAETVDLQIVVLKKERVNADARAFVNVGGFVIRRLSAPYDKAECPNASNTKGEVLCKIECTKKDAALRLYVKSPNHTDWPAVRGYFQPNEAAFELANCSVSAVQPILLTYKTRDVILGEFHALNPSILSALVENPGGWDGSTTPKLKPFVQTSGALAQVAGTADGKQAVVKFAELSAAIAQDAKDARNNELATRWDEYAVGSQSIAFRASVGAALGEGGIRLVRISPKKSDLFQSAASVEKQIGIKPSLGPRDLAVLQEVRSIQQNRTLSP